MCNLTENPNEFLSEDELMNDPQYLQYLELQYKQMDEDLNQYLKSLEEKVEREIDPYEQSHLI